MIGIRLTIYGNQSTITGTGNQPCTGRATTRDCPYGDNMKYDASILSFLSKFFFFFCYSSNSIHSLLLVLQVALLIKITYNLFINSWKHDCHLSLFKKLENIKQRGSGSMISGSLYWVIEISHQLGTVVSD